MLVADWEELIAEAKQTLQARSSSALVLQPPAPLSPPGSQPVPPAAHDGADVAESDLVGQLRAQIITLKKQLARVRRGKTMLRILKKQLQKLRKENKELRLKLDASQKSLTITRGQKGVRLDYRGQVCVALRRSFGNVGAGNFGRVVLEDIGRGQVIRAKLCAAAGLVAYSRLWHEECWQAFGFRRLHDGTWRLGVPSGHAAEGCSISRFSVVTCTSDGTNSAIWNKSKLCAVLVDSLYMPDASVLAECAWHEACLRCTSLGDLQIVDAKSDGLANLGITLKVFKNLHAMTWEDAKSVGADLPSDSVHVFLHLQRWWS